MYVFHYKYSFTLKASGLKTSSVHKSTKMSVVIIMKQQSDMEWHWLTSSSSCSTWDVTHCCSVYPPSLLVLCALGSFTRPIALNLPTGPCKLCCCQVTSSQETNLYCQCPASTTNTPELGHAFYSSPRHTGPGFSIDCCAEVQEGEVILQKVLF